MNDNLDGWFGLKKDTIADGFDGTFTKSGPQAAWVANETQNYNRNKKYYHNQPQWCSHHFWYDNHTWSHDSLVRAQILHAPHTATQ